MEQAKPRKTIVRTSAGIRDALIDEMERLANGETDAKTASAMARLGQCIVSTVQLELDVHRAKEALPKRKPAEDDEGGVPSLSLSPRSRAA